GRRRPPRPARPPRGARGAPRPPRGDSRARARRAVAEGNRLSGAPAAPERGAVGYQGAGPDPAARFAQELAAAGGVCHRVADEAAAVSAVVELVRARGARRALLGGGALIGRPGLAPGPGAGRPAARGARRPHT